MSHTFGTRPETLRKAVAATRRCSICGRDVRASMLVPHENRHRVESQTKDCEQCGATIRRNSRAGQKQWDEKRFCSRRCRGKWYGAPANAPKTRRIPLEDSYVVVDSGCWEWTRTINASGYGVGNIHGQTTHAHRVLWEVHRGPIPAGLHLDHLCRNTRCVNPDHMEPVTPAENIRRANAVRFNCRHGHPFDEANTYRDRRGFRGCRACRREAEQRHRARRKEAARVLAA